MKTERLEDLIETAESRLVELKREWFNLGSNEGKGTLVKEILALSNAAEKGETAYLIIGVTDESEGKEIVGVPRSPDTDRLHNIIDSFTTPTPEVVLTEVELNDDAVDVLKIEGVGQGPFYAKDSAGDVLSSFYVYTRRGATISRVPPPEFEKIIRNKIAGSRGSLSQRRIRAGFTSPRGWEFDQAVGIRAVNISEEPLEHVYIVLRAQHLQPYATAVRQILYGDAKMWGGNSRTTTVRYEKLDYRRPNGEVLSWEEIEPRTGIELTLCVQYEDRDGFVKRFIREFSVGG